MNLAKRPGVSQLIDLALEEDLGRGDATTSSLGAADHQLNVAVVARETLVLAGIEIAQEVFQRVDDSLDLSILKKDGSKLAAGEQAMMIRGNAASVLMAERTALNFLQRLSGIATLASRFVNAVSGTSARVVDTRKTTPGYRALAKAAVLAGGAFNHRADLGSGILIKDNHIAAVGSVKAAVQKAKQNAPHSLRIEVEVDTEAQLDEALSVGVDIVLLDNFSPKDVKRLAEKAKAKGVLVECSGGITLETIRDYALAGADVISSGAITHSAVAVDLGLDAVNM